MVSTESIIPKIFASFKDDKEVLIIMTGLEGSGKTTVLNKLKFDDTIMKIPSEEFSIENISYKNIQIINWDIELTKLKDFLSKYNSKISSFIFVVDSGDNDRLGMARDAFLEIIKNDEYEDTPFLIISNKCDLNVNSNQNIVEKMNILSVKNRIWLIQDVSALSGEGLQEGLSWISSIILK